MAAARADRELLAETAHAPLACKLHGLRVGELKRIDDVAPHQVRLWESRQLEDASPDRQHAALLVGHEHPGVRRRVVVVEDLEEEPEPAPAAGGRLLGGALARGDVERTLLSFWAKVVRHAAQRSPELPAQARGVTRSIECAVERVSAALAFRGHPTDAAAGHLGAPAPAGRPRGHEVRSLAEIDQAR